MTLAFSLGITSFLFTLLLTPVIRDYFLQRGFVDIPDDIRKLHRGAIPRVGGIAIALSYTLAFMILGFLPFPQWNAPTLQKLGSPAFQVMFAGALLIFLIGLLDDFFNIRAWQKLLTQIVAALMVFGGGMRIQLHSLRGSPFEDIVSCLLTVVWIVGCTNAFNLIDGLDGLASGVGLFATITILLAALIHNDMGLIVLTLPLAGSLLGFLRYNFNPASIFLGDCGSLLIGFLLGCFSVEWSHKSATLLGLTAPLMALAVPLLDVTLSIARRFLRSRPVFGADRGHIHHRLLDKGLHPRQVALVAYGVSFLAACFSLLQNSLSHNYGGLIIVLFGLITWIGIQNLGYVEFSLASRLLLRGGVGRMIDFESKLQHFQAATEKADTVDAVWEAVQKGSRELGFQGSRLSLFGKVSIDLDAGAQESVQVRIPLAYDNYVNFYGIEDTIKSIDLNSFLPVVTQVLNAKIKELMPLATQKKTELQVGKPKLVKTA